jgi:hypothetical protein
MASPSASERPRVGPTSGTWLRRGVLALAAVNPGPGLRGRVVASLRTRALRGLLGSMLQRSHLVDLLETLGGDGAAAGADAGPVTAALRRWNTTCLPRALAGYAVLRAHGRDPTFVIGVRPEAGDLAAHAWLEERGLPLDEPGDPRARWAVAFTHPPRAGDRAAAPAAAPSRSPMSQLRPNPDALLTELKDGSGVLLHLRTKFYYALNRTGVAVWKQVVAGVDDPDAVTRAITEQFRDAPPADVRRDVTSLLAELVEEGLLLRADAGSGAGG